jgi:hypothetical protein
MDPIFHVPGYFALDAYFSAFNHDLDASRFLLNHWRLILLVWIAIRYRATLALFAMILVLVYPRSYRKKTA